MTSPQPAPQQPIAPHPMQQRHHRKASTVTLKTPMFVAILVAVIIMSFLAGLFLVGFIVEPELKEAQQASASWESKYKKQKAYSDLLDKGMPSKSEESDSASSTGTDSSNANKLAGESETNGTLAMTFASYEEIPSVPQEWNGTQPALMPQAGTRFISVKVVLTNNGKAPVDVTCGYVVDIRAVNSSSQQYTPIDELYKIPGNPMCNAQLQPGMNENVNYVFNVPQDAKMVGFAWRDVTDISVDNQYSTFVFKQGYSLE